MVSKSLSVAITALSVFVFSSCSSLPWNRQGDPAKEVNLAFTIENNLIFLSTVNVNHQPGRILFGSAEPQTVLDPEYASRVRATTYGLHLNERQTLRFKPAVVSLHGVADAVIGADVWDSHAVTIDYRTGLVTYQIDGIHPDYMSIYRYDAAPSAIATIDGRDTSVIVDTASPDTIVLPRGNAAAGRTRARVTIAGTDFGAIDIALGDVSAPRVGNRLLSKFLVSIDYGKREVGLWRDPRIAMDNRTR